MAQSSSRTRRHFAVENLGCAKNQVDAEVMIRYLENAGWTYTDDFSQAEVILVNSCGFIEPAKEESINATLDLRDRYPDAKIILTGCLSQRYGEELYSGLHEADGIFGNRNLSQIVDVADVVSGGQKVLQMPDYAGYDRCRSTLLSRPASAYLKVSEGCNHRCSFCAIPLIRGGLRSISRPVVVEEARRLVDQGIFEINLIAQDLASYGGEHGKSEKGGSDIIPLLRELAALSGDFRIRLLYIHPDAFPRELISVVRDHPKILPYFDIPFQHASRKILRTMGRDGEAESYLSLLEEIRGGLSDAVIRTTFLVGFYGEGRREFEELKEFQEAAEFDWAGVFTYSPEEGTAAMAYEGRPGFERDAAAAAEREKELKSIQHAISERKMDRFVGQSMWVLMEEKVQGEDLMLGRGYLHAPEVDGAVVVHTPDEAESPGDVRRCKIVRRNNIDLEAVPDER